MNTATRTVRLRASERRALARGLWAIPCPACGRRALSATGGTVPVSLSCAKCHIVRDLPAVPVFEIRPWQLVNARTVLSGFVLR